MTDRALWLDTVELRRHTGTRRSVCLDARLPDLAVGDCAVVDGELRVDVIVEAVTEGVVVKGRACGRWQGPCRRCLEPAGGELVVELHEIFESNPTEGETWPLTDEGIDLAPMLRETALLALPLAPLCRDDCEGPEPARFPTGAVDEVDGGVRGDPRWAALDQLTFED